jgi:hypothetical protein
MSVFFYPKILGNAGEAIRRRRRWRRRRRRRRRRSRQWTASTTAQRYNITSTVE